MKKKVLLLLLLIIFISLLFVPLNALAEGWTKVDGYWYYYTSANEYKTGWFFIDDYWYYFKDDGKMVTGLKYLSYNGEYDYYYFSEEANTLGKMKTGWIKALNHWYLFDSSGRAVKGWHTSNGNTYYFYDTGEMATGKKYLSSQGYYFYFSEEVETDKSMYVEAHIKTQADLDDYLNTTGHNLTGDHVFFENTENIQFPKDEVYYINSNDITGTAFADWYLTSSSKGNIDFNSSTFLIGENASFLLQGTGDHKKNGVKQVISNGTFYGSVSNRITEAGNVASTRGHFNADLIHASYIEFKNLTFNNAQDVHSHIFDVVGCDHITFDGIISRGYLGNFTQQELKNVWDSGNWSSIYAEAIEIDSANPGAAGIDDLDSTGFFNNSMNDGKSSTNISIINSYFGPYNGVTGQSIIDKENNIVVKPYGATIGSHEEDRVNGTSSYTNINISNNSLVNTIYIDRNITTSGEIENRKQLYPIHLQTHIKTGNPVLTVSNNRFVNQYSGYTDYGVEVWGQTGYYGISNSQTNNIPITDANANSSADNATEVKSKIKKAGIQQTGLITADSKTYYARKTENEISTGPKGSLITNECFELNNKMYCANSQGELTELTKVAIPTNSMCNDLTYNTEEQTLTMDAPAGYTWSNNKQTNSGNYQVTATLNSGYAWSDNTRTSKTITCEIKKVVRHKVDINNTWLYRGTEIIPGVFWGDTKIMNLTGTTRATNVGNYNMVVSLKDKDNYVWKDGTTDDISLDWVITTYSINSYSVDETDDIIKDIPANTELSEFSNKFTLGTNLSLEVDYKEIGNKKLLFTGGKTKIISIPDPHIGEKPLKSSYTNIVMGDTSGDGNVNYLDYVKVYNHIQKEKHPESSKQLLKGPYLLAADMSKDNKITYLDYVKIYNKIKELKGGKN